MRLIAEGRAPRIPQPEEGATYEGIQKKETAKVSARDPAHPAARLCSDWDEEGILGKLGFWLGSQIVIVLSWKRGLRGMGKRELSCEWGKACGTQTGRVFFLFFSVSL